MEGVSRASGAGYLIVRIPKRWIIGEPVTDKSLSPEDDGGFDEYKWPGLRVEEYAIVEQHILKDRVSPIDAVLPELEKLSARTGRAAKRLARALEEKAYADLRKSKAQNKLSIEEVQAFIDSPEGLLFTMKLTISRYHPDITDGEIRRIFEWVGEKEAKRLRDLAQGVDALGNSTGRSDAAGAPAEPTTGRLTGDGFIVGSPKPTDGTPARSTP